MVAQDNTDNSLRKKSDPFLGAMLGGRYKILSLVGQGSTTSVYRGQDINRADQVAIKILHFQLRSNEMTVRRFEQEIKTTSRLNHVNIVSYRDSGKTDDDEPYLVIEYVEGKNLHHLVQERGYLDWKRTLSIFVQICAALNAAHQAGIVHRDLKPANIMVTRDGKGNEIVKVLDFGVAKLLIQGETFQTKTQTGEMLGTLLYMSPEQCMDEDLDGRSDIYSLGCVLFEALTGTAPFTARTAFETMNLHLTSSPGKLKNARPDLTFPKSLDYIIQKATEKDQKKRYQNVNDLADDLTKLLSNENHVVAVVANNKLSKADPSDSKQMRYYALAIVAFISLGVLPFMSFGIVKLLTYVGIVSVCLVIINRDKARKKAEMLTLTKKPEGKLIATNSLTEKDGQSGIQARSESKSDYSVRYTYFPGYVNVDEHVSHVFDRVDANKDGYITKDELTEILNVNSSRLTAHDKTLIEFLLQHYGEMKEIFDDQNIRVGISRAEVLTLTKNIDLNAIK